LRNKKLNLPNLYVRQISTFKLLLIQVKDGFKLDQGDVFKIIQKYTQDVPLIVIGTGGTIPYGIPGMSQLADYLIAQVGAKHNSDKDWSQFQERLTDGLDLESALTGLNLSEQTMYDITSSTWCLWQTKSAQNSSVKVPSQIAS
jgi:hypothetical protein